MCVDREPHVKVLSEGHYQTSVGHSDGGQFGYSGRTGSQSFGYSDLSC